MRECVILVGLQGAGKSTFYRQRLAATHRLVSKDLFPNVRDRNRQQIELVEAALREGASVAIDNTNPTVADRAPLIELAHRYGAIATAYYFDASTRECVARNRGREARQRVPDVAIFTTAKKLVPPSHNEGFENVFVVRLVEGDWHVAQLGQP